MIQTVINVTISSNNVIVTVPLTSILYYMDNFVYLNNNEELRVVETREEIDRQIIPV
jgi:hypothetical protein